LLTKQSLIGGGIIGCTTAYYLTRHPSFDPNYHLITLLEATRIAGGASGKAGGLLAQWAYPASIVALSFDLHQELAEAHDGVQQWGYRRVQCGKLTAKDENLLTGKNGVSWTQFSSWASLGKRKYQKKNSKNVPISDLPNDLDWFNVDCVESYEDISTTSDTAQVNPYQFTTTMARLAEEAGVKVIIGSVDKIGYTDFDTQSPAQQSGASETAQASEAPRGKRVQSVIYIDKATSESRSIPATTVILAAGPWTPVLFPSAPISALRAHSVTVRPTRPVSAYCLFTEISVPRLQMEDNDASEDGYSAALQGGTKITSPEIYSRPNNEVYICGAGDNASPLPATTDDVEISKETCQSLIDAISGISKVLSDGTVTSRRACYLPTVDLGGSGGPLVGPTGVSGLLMAAGHGCWGIHNAPATGKLISEIIFDGKAISADIRGLDPRLVV
jgi:glycine/D-amino acid oxidase-like deaminating enzyme